MEQRACASALAAADDVAWQHQPPSVIPRAAGRGGGILPDGVGPYVLDRQQPASSKLIFDWPFGRPLRHADYASATTRQPAPTNRWRHGGERLPTDREFRRGPRAADLASSELSESVEGVLARLNPLECGPVDVALPGARLAGDWLQPHVE